MINGIYDMISTGRQPLVKLMPYIDAAEGLIAIEKWKNHEAKSRIEDEIESAENYLADYKSTGDRDYLDMAADETRHAKKLMMAGHANHIYDKMQMQDVTKRYEKVAEEVKRHGEKSVGIGGYSL